MMQLGLIGIGAGAAAALLFASLRSGIWLSIPLFYLAPLPLMIAGLGWSHWAALIAGAVGALALAVAFGPVFFLTFLGGVSLPAWWLCYLVMLARPAGNGGTPALEWYPPGRLVIWAAVLAASIVIAAVSYFGLNDESVRAGLRHTLMIILRGDPDTPADAALPGVTNTARLVDFLVAAIPPAAAVLATITNVLNIWLAARIVKFSGLLKRPWPPLPALSFPRLLAAALALAVAVSFAGGFIGIIAGVLSSSLLMAYGLLGFAVLHAITLGLSARAFVLGGVYASVLVFGWPMLALCALGLIEAALDLRARIARRRGPPAVS